ncbi:hypothetical protein VKT23_017804 [Stygiomarasmius scandens]|uniref:Uncharacterized protein n=1 Tax=Marasmiellus scandens TaxID=2682957 RepID=A0ABR1ITW5_9AGAR
MSSKPSQLQQKQSTPTQSTTTRTTTSSTRITTTSYMHGASQYVLDGMDMQTVEGTDYNVGKSESQPQGRDDFFKDASGVLQRMRESTSTPNTGSSFYLHVVLSCTLKQYIANAPSAQTASVTFFTDSKQFAARNTRVRHVHGNQFNFPANIDPKLAAAIVGRAALNGLTPPQQENH